MSVYAGDKSLWHLDRLLVLQEGRQPAPVHVQMIISDLCSQDCSFCAYRKEGYSANQLFAVVEADGVRNNNPNRMLSIEKAREILDDCKAIGVKAIQFTGGGEPTVHPHHHDIFQYALDLDLEIALVTHGALLRVQTIELLARATWARVSLDAGTPETYEAIRRVSHRQFHAAIKTIGRLCEARDSNGSPLVVGVGFVATKENWREVGLAAEIARNCGADNFRISAVFQGDGDRYFQDFAVEADELCKQAELLSTDRFKVVNMFGNRLADLHQGAPDYSFCGYQNFTTYVGADLNVYRCCTQAYNERGLIGSLKDQTFRQLWESQAKRDDFASFDARGCSLCQFNDRNRVLIKTLRKPSHENFV